MKKSSNQVLNNNINININNNILQINNNQIKKEPLRNHGGNLNKIRSVGKSLIDENIFDKSNNSDIGINSIKDYFFYVPKIGLANIGATCYMNATLQCLCQIEQFTSFFKYDKYVNIVSNKYLRKNEKCLSSSFKILMEKLWPQIQTRETYYEPHEFRKKIADMNPLFQKVEANDAKDLVNFIIMTLHEELNININQISNMTNNNINNKIINQNNPVNMFNEFYQDYLRNFHSMISDLFYAIQETKTKCLKCNNIQYNYQAYFFLVFPLEEVKKHAINKLNQSSFNLNNMNAMNNMNNISLNNNFNMNININQNMNNFQGNMNNNMNSNMNNNIRSSHRRSNSMDFFNKNMNMNNICMNNNNMVINNMNYMIRDNNMIMNNVNFMNNNNIISNMGMNFINSNNMLPGYNNFNMNNNSNFNNFRNNMNNNNSFNSFNNYGMNNNFSNMNMMNNNFNNMNSMSNLSNITMNNMFNMGMNNMSNNLQNYNSMNNMNNMGNISMNSMMSNPKMQKLNNNIVDLFDCLEYNKKVDLFTGTNQIYCNNCQSMSDAHYSSTLVNAPKVLILLLNRGVGIQFKIKLEFPMELNISSQVNQNLIPNQGNMNYKLIGVITHIGESGQGGHFIAHCLSPIDSEWYTYNDAIVSKIDDIKRQVIDLGMPYLLFYQRKD